MGYAKNYAARTFSKGTKALILARQSDDAGVVHCGHCDKPLVDKGVRVTAFRFDHIIPYDFKRWSGPSNGQALCADGPLSCDALKTNGRDLPAIAKNRRLRKRRKVRHPFPCGRESRFSKPIHGVPVPRTTLAQKHAATMRKRTIFPQQPEASQ